MLNFFFSINSKKIKIFFFKMFDFIRIDNVATFIQIQIDDNHTNWIIIIINICNEINNSNCLQNWTRIIKTSSSKFIYYLKSFRSFWSFCVDRVDRVDRLTWSTRSFLCQIVDLIVRINLFWLDIIRVLWRFQYWFLLNRNTCFNLNLHS